MKMLKSLIHGFSRTKRLDDHSTFVEQNQCTLCTTFSRSGFELYGRRFLESFIKFWPYEFELYVYLEDMHFESPDPRIKIFDLHREIPELVEFKNINDKNIYRGFFYGKYDYRLDAIKFSNKSFVMWHTFKISIRRYLIWLDADVNTFLNIPSSFIAAIMRDKFYMAYLGRRCIHSETGFIVFDRSSEEAVQVISMLHELYVENKIFSLQEWTDSFAIDFCRNVVELRSEKKSNNLNLFHSMHPFINSAPGLFMDHMKGSERKSNAGSWQSDYIIPPPQRTNFFGGRYSQIPVLISDIKPKSILEIGTWNGWRGIQMCLIALQFNPEIRYEGFDLFEEADINTDQQEMNVKPHYTVDSVDRLFSILQSLYPRFEYGLQKGNTNSTLVEEKGVDFAFVDGGHSVNTIRHDYSMVAKSKVVCLDDFYSGEIDSENFGCNRVIDGESYALLEIKDPVHGGGYTQLALIDNRVRS